MGNSDTATAADAPTLYTVGHSTRGIEEFIALLRAHGIRRLVDVRRFPMSRRHPHFNAEPLATSLREAGIAYAHEEALGGRRPVREDSPNGAWREKGFRGYADYMDSEQFRAALDALVATMGRERTCVMCAEAVPWRCHRRLIADALVARGARVLHIMTDARADAHELPEFARVEQDGRVVYPAGGAQQRSLF